MPNGGARGQATVDMEVEFLNLGLDIIGLGVFNYDFGSITSESPVIKARGPPPPRHTIYSALQLPPLGVSFENHRCALGTGRWLQNDDHVFASGDVPLWVGKSSKGQQQRSVGICLVAPVRCMVVPFVRGFLWRVERPGLGMMWK